MSTKNFLPKLLILFIGIQISFSVASSELKQILIKIPGVVSVEQLEVPTFFKEKYLILFEQYLDKDKPEEGKFTQRVILSHKDFHAPVVYITEGYSADYALSRTHINELSDLIGANQICVEHRYFGESIPKLLNWEYLTAKNASDDLHKIYNEFKKLYRNQWLSTGISKGGQTSVIYRMFYPEDMGLTVAYVAPFARALEDGRHEIFINRISSKKDRKKVKDFQLEVLKRREELMPIFKSMINESKLSFSIPIEEVYDYCVLEYSFAFWQWIGDTERIPGKKANNNQILMHLMTVSSPDYFSIEGIKPVFPFFYQAAKELGYYGYETKGFEKLLVIENAKNYFENIFLTPNISVDFNDSLIISIEKFIKNKASNIIFIYGEFDPWTAVAAETGDNKNIMKIVSPRGTHSIRIKSMPKIYHDIVIEALRNWAGK